MNNVFPVLNISTTSHLAMQLKYSEDKIHQTLQRRSVKEFKIPKKKRDGSLSERVIHSPNKEYKNLLRKIHALLLKSVRKKIPLGILGGFPKGTLKKMVAPHCNAEAIYVVDLENFFPNISYEQVFNFFKKKARCSQEISTLLADLTTYNGCLPQGFPTSSTLANILAFKMDQEHLNICNKFKLKRTRWIDDIVFSGRLADLEKATGKIKTAIKINDFLLNKRKEIFIRRKNNPVIVGLQINKKTPHIPRTLINEISDQLNYICVYGLDHAKIFFDYEKSFKKDWIKSFEGKIRHIATYNPNDSKHLQTLFEEAKQHVDFSK